MQLFTRHTIVLGTGSLFFLLLPPIAHIAGEPYLVSLFSRILIYALAAVSLDLLLGYGGLVSLGHAAYLGLGAYVVAIFHQHGFDLEPIISWPVVIEGSENGLIVWPIAVGTAALGALLFGALSLRTQGMHFIMITLAFAQMLYYFFISLGKYGGSDGVSLYSRNSLAGFDLADDMQFYYLCLFFLCLFLVLAGRLTSSRFGLVLRGAKNNTRRINALGISDYRYKLTCFVIAGAGAGLAGVLLANHTEYVSPGLLHWTMSGELMVMVLLGGLGTLYGPVAGATLFLLLEEFLAIYTEHWMVYMGPVLILIVIFARRGIYGALVGMKR